MAVAVTRDRKKSGVGAPADVAAAMETSGTMMPHFAALERQPGLAPLRAPAFDRAGDDVFLAAGFAPQFGK